MARVARSTRRPAPTTEARRRPAIACAMRPSASNVRVRRTTTRIATIGAEAARATDAARTSDPPGARAASAAIPIIVNTSCVAMHTVTSTTRLAAACGPRTPRWIMILAVASSPPTRATGMSPFTASRTHTSQVKNGSDRPRPPPPPTRSCHARAFSAIGRTWSRLAQTTPSPAIPSAETIVAKPACAKNAVASASPARRGGARRESRGDGARRARGPAAALAEELEELDPLAKAASHHVGAPEHLAHDLRDLAAPEVEAPVEGLQGRVDLGMGEVWVAERRELDAVLVHQLRVRGVEPAFLDRLTVELGPRVGSGERHLDGVGVELAGEPDRLRDRLPRLAGQAEDEAAVDGDPEVMAVIGEPPHDVEADPLLDVVQDHLVSRLVAHQEEPQPVIPEHLERAPRDVRLRRA